MKAIKKILKYLSIFILVLLIALISVPFMFKGKLIDIAKEQINNQVNAKIEFGEFDLSIFSTFPNLLFEINNVKVDGVGPFEGETLFKMDKLGAKVDIMSVFGDNIKVIGISLDRPIINAKVLPDSTANWDIAKASTDTAVVETEEEETATDDKAGSFKLSLKSFEINNADISYDDLLGNMFAEIEGLTFSLSGDLGSENTQLTIATIIKKLTFKQDGVKLVNKAELEYKADLDADLVNSKYTFKENLFRINALELAFDGFVQMKENSDINLDIKFNTNKTDFKSLLSMVPAVYMTDFEAVQTKGNLELNGFAKGTYNETTLPAFDLTLKVGDAMFKYPDLPAAATNIAIDLNVNNKDGVEDNTVINLKKFHVELADNPIDFSLLTKTPISDPYIDGNLKAKINFDKIKTVVPLDSMDLSGEMTSDISFKGNLSTIEQERYEDFQAQGILALKDFVFKSADFEQGVKISETELEFTPKFVALNKFATQIGKSDISANGRIDNLLSYYFKDDLLKGEFNVNSNLIDANEFMSDQETETTEPVETASTEQTSESTGTTEEAGVVEIPKNIDFVLNTNFKKVLYEDLLISDINGAMSLKEGIASMDNLKMNMLDGSLNMSGDYSTADITKPSAKMVFGINSFDINKTYKSFKIIQEQAPIAKNCSGKFSMILQFNSLLNDSMMPVMSTVNGGGMFSSNNIIIDNSDVFNKLAGLLNNDKYKTLELEDLNIKFKIVDGNIEVEPFKTKSGKTEFEIGGKQGIDQSLDYKMNLKIPRSELGSSANAVANSLSALAGANGVNLNLGETININGLITGTVQNPKISLDLKKQGQDAVEDIKEQVKEVVKQEIDKAKKQAIEEAKKQAAKLYTEAEKQAANIKNAAQQTAKSIRSNGVKGASNLRKEAKAQGDKLIKEAGANPLKKAAAKETAKRLVKEADKKAKQIENEANSKANKVVTEANKKADGVLKTAKDKGDELIRKAENA